MTVRSNHSRSRLTGIAFMVAAVFAFAVMDSLMKRLSDRYPPLQIACLRSTSSLALLALWIACRGRWTTLAGSSPALHVLRGLLGVALLVSFVFAMHRLTLAQTYSLLLSAPLLMTALSVPLLGEQVTAHRWLAIGGGMGGVLLILQPWSKGSFPPAAAAAAAAATLCYCLSALTGRSMSARNSSLGMVFWYLLMVALGSALLAAGTWRPIARDDWGWLAALGVSGAFGQLWLTDAFARAPPSVVGPFEYTAILWAFAIDWVFWSASPSPNLMVGAAIVIASGLYVIVDEHRLARDGGETTRV